MINRNMERHRISIYVNYYPEGKERRHSYNTMRMAISFSIEMMLIGNIFVISLSLISKA